MLRVLSCAAPADVLTLLGGCFAPGAAGILHSDTLVVHTLGLLTPLLLLVAPTGAAGILVVRADRSRGARGLLAAACGVLLLLLRPTPEGCVSPAEVPRSKAATLSDTQVQRGLRVPLRLVRGLFLLIALPSMSRARLLLLLLFLVLATLLMADGCRDKLAIKEAPTGP